MSLSSLRAAFSPRLADSSFPVFFFLRTGRMLALLFARRRSFTFLAYVVFSELAKQGRSSYPTRSEIRAISQGTDYPKPTVSNRHGKEPVAQILPVEYLLARRKAEMVHYRSKPDRVYDIDKMDETRGDGNLEHS
ncbi:hypothetical protein GOBAR_DD10892 [Gossypium barbadense]|nr:hypothetical protein GOBAR_DD10892 [Gossypium barbadense]